MGRGAALPASLQGIADSLLPAAAGAQQQQQEQQLDEGLSRCYARGISQGSAAAAPFAGLKPWNLSSGPLAPSGMSSLWQQAGCYSRPGLRPAAARAGPGVRTGVSESWKKGRQHVSALAGIPVPAAACLKGCRAAGLGITAGWCHQQLLLQELAAGRCH
ncbi:hypothetical protein COO60DRAFT_234648 [Scenedesmus sp. NREL 46B-D3]|nr:hypothetical protein COO60DRAFT_234648 [Scenedesmus sp. NREL 46B-D3]